MNATMGVRHAALSALVLLVALPATLEACASAGAPAGPVRPAGNVTSAAGSATTSTATSTTTPAPRPNGAVTLTVGRTRYASSASIVVTIHNAASTTIYAREQNTSCSMVLLQRRVNGAWQPVSPCLDGFPHTTIGQIAPGAAVPVELAPQSAGSTEGGGSGGAGWPAGTYRAALSYTTSASMAFGQGTLIFSSTFAVG